MTFDQLIYFVAAVEADSFFEAAEKVHTTQSTLSKQIIRMEKELQAELFSRDKRKAELTEAGALFYQDAKILIAQYDLSLKRLRDQQNRNDHTVRIGTLPFQAQYRLPRLMQTFQDAYPAIHMVIEEEEEERLRIRFERHEYDLVFMRSEMLDPLTEEGIETARDELMLILSDQHPALRMLQQRQREGIDVPALSALNHEKFVLMNRHTSIYRTSHSVLSDAGLSGNIMGTARPESMINQAGTSHIIGLLPKTTWQLFRQEHVAAVPLEPSVDLSVFLVCKKDRKKSAAMNTFIRFVRSETDHFNTEYKQ